VAAPLNSRTIRRAKRISYALGLRSLLAMTVAAPAKQRKTTPAAPRVSRLQAPPGMAVAAWQVALRRQFGRELAEALSGLLVRANKG
jgi:hypothetical protein